jgi:hypothetical protein
VLVTSYAIARRTASGRRKGFCVYARLLRFSLGPGKRALAEAITDEIAPLIAAQPGCEGVTVFGDDADGDYGIFVLWDSAEHANTAAGIVPPKLDEHFAGNVTSTPEARLFEVLSQ